MTGPGNMHPASPGHLPPPPKRAKGSVGRPRTIQRQIDPLVTALHRERLRQGLSQTTLARRMGLMTYGTISEHERGVNQPTLALLRRWSAALGCHLTVEPHAQAAQERYDAGHDPADHHCLTDPCAWHPAEQRIRPRPMFTARLISSGSMEGADRG